MKTDRGSILWKLQGGFALAAILLATGMALFMDHSLRKSLETEDAQVMESQARALLEQLRGSGPVDSRAEPLLEKAEWRFLDGTGVTRRQSPGMARLPEFTWPPPGQIREVELPGKGTFSLMVRALNLPSASGAWEAGSREGMLLLAMDRTHEEELVKGFRRTLALGAFTAAILAALLGRWIAAWGLAPLRQISGEASAISEQNLDHRLDAGHFPSELQELVATLNGVLARLEESFQRLEHLGAELAHELRTPLQNLRSTLENALLSPSQPGPALLGGLLEDCDRLGALIEQILFLARRGDGSSGLEKKVLSTFDLLEETRSFFEAAAEESGISLALVPGAELQVQGDRLLLLRALHNLASNALKHTLEGGRIGLGASAETGWVTLWVQDDGPGIPSEWIPRLGAPFVRGPGSASREGLGLGLAIVRRVAQIHGGEMRIQSEPGQGARMELRLPSRSRG